jgi:hypothetical protein
MRIIAFTGKKGHGKSTSTNKAREVLEGQGLTVKRINFKDSLVTVINSKCKGVLEDLSKHYNMSIDDLFENKPPIMRRLMQFIGTDVYREMNNGFWVDSWASKLDPYKRSDVVIIVDDVRFQNEFDMVKSMGGSVTRIVATNKEIPLDEHASEKEQDSFNVDREFHANSKEELEQIIEAKLTEM